MSQNDITLTLNKENEDILLEGEYSLLVEERTRRSQEQTEYLKFVLIGIVGQFMVLMLDLINSDDSIFEKIEPATLEVVLLIVSGGVVILTTIIFLLWLDHAITISAIDNFFKKKEKQNEVFGWYQFREEYSKHTVFNLFGFKINLMGMKIQLFKFSIFTSFLIPPVIFVFMAFVNTHLEEYQDIVEIVNIAIFTVFTLILLFGLVAWSYSGKGIYFYQKLKDSQ